VDPEALLGHLRAELAREVLRHARRDVVAVARILEPRGIDHHQVGRFDFRGHLGQLKCDRLVFGDRLAEGLALLGVPHGEFERADADTTRPRRDVHPADLDAVHHLEEPLPGCLAENVAGIGHIAVEDQLGGIDALVSEFVDLARDRQSRSDFPETGWLLD